MSLLSSTRQRSGSHLPALPALAAEARPEIRGRPETPRRDHGPPTGILSAAGRRRLTDNLSLFHRKFPRTTFEVVVIELPVGRAIGEYAVWLANRMRFSAAEATGERNFDFLLVVNVAGASGLSADYGLENLVAEEELARVLEAGRAEFAAEHWVAGIEVCVDCLTERLRELCREKK